MRKIQAAIYIIYSLLFLPALGQNSGNKEKAYFKYAVFFKDKKNSPYSLAAPEAFLSPRAIQRRQRMNIPLDSTDLPVNPAYIQGVLKSHPSLSFVSKANWSNYIIVRTEDSNAAVSIKNLPYVKEVREIFNPEKATKDLMALFSALLEPKNLADEKGANIQTLTTLNYGQSETQVSMIGTHFLHHRGAMGEGIVIAVLDGGFYRVDILPAFQSLRENGQILGTWDFVENHDSVYEDNSHGMMVLSTMAGVVDGKLIGTAPKAKFWLLRTEDANSETISEEYNWEAGALFADSVGADIINSSLGYTKFDNDIGSHTYEDLTGDKAIATKAANMAFDKGILVINSAGNEGSSPWRYIGVPADGKKVLAVGAVKSDRTIASFSSRGPTADGRIKPDVCAMGEQTTFSNTDGSISRGNGTSFSAPVLSGATASLWSLNPNATNKEIFDAILRSADRYGNPDNDYGYGIPNMGTAHLILNKQYDELLHGKPDILVYPNPIDSRIFFVDYLARQASQILIRLTDASGKRVLEKRENVAANALHHMTLELPPRAAAGTYNLTLQDGALNISKKLVVP